MTMAKKIHLVARVPAELAGQRLDRVLVQLFPEYSRAQLQQWVRQQHVKVNQRLLKQSEKVTADAEIFIDAELITKTTWSPQAQTLSILHEDEAIIVLNKPAGLVVHPAAGNWDNTLVNALLYQFPELAKLPRAGLIHRLDKNTTGVMIIARHLEAHTVLVKALQAREIHREYCAIVYGAMTAGGTIDAPIRRHPHQRLKMAVLSDGKPAITHYRILQRFRDFTYLKLQLVTGRTHQIRVHLSHQHFPLVGDSLYGGKLRLPLASDPILRETLKNFHRQALHAKQLTLAHPSTQQTLNFIAPVPNDLETLLTHLQLYNAS